MQGDFRFGDWVVQPAQCRLSRDGQTLQVRAKVMDLLVYLAAAPGEVVSKERLLNEVWGSLEVSESALTRTVTELRQALGDSADAPRLLETIPKRGYRLIGSVEPLSAATPPPPPPPASKGRTGAALRVAVAATAALLLLAFASWAWFRGDARGTSVRLAVLPFDHLGDRGGREYLADGLAEDTTVSLGMIDPESLIVIGRTSTLRYRNTTKSLEEIGQELGVDYLVESTVRTDGDRLRLTSKLVRARDQALVWSQPYERKLTDVLGLDLALSTAIAEQIRFRISNETRASIERRQTRNAKAYDLYMRGRTLWMQRKPASNRLALEYYKAAIALDPRYALAWSGIADDHSASPVNGDADPAAVGALARDAAGEAVRAESELAEAQVSQALVDFWLSWNWSASERTLRHALTLNPGYALAHMQLGNVFSHSERHQEAREAIRRARALDPLDPMLHAISSQHALHARDYPGAIEYARQALGIDQEFWVGHMMLGQALERLGEHDAALQSLGRAEQLSGGNSKPVSTKGYVLAKAGRTTEARAVLDELKARRPGRYVPSYAIALVQAGLGDREALFQSLEAAFTANDVHLVFLPVDPKWDQYRNDPRFQALLEQCGFMTGGRRRSARAHDESH
jgi:DNA-binding winged helix-turn-helix (wHTH) protein/TolB-like protein/tetratricopeptide (TPR) repeat protein